MIDGHEWAAHPQTMFQDQWEGSGDFLGSDRSASLNADSSVRLAIALAAANNGILYSMLWLKRNHFGALARIIKKYPERFSHILQESDLDGHVREAESLAKRFRGVLPSKSWMERNGNTKLAKVMKDHPSRFRHFTRIANRQIQQPGDAA